MRRDVVQSNFREDIIFCLTYLGEINGECLGKGWSKAGESEPLMQEQEKTEKESK